MKTFESLASPGDHPMHFKWKLYQSITSFISDNESNLQMKINDYIVVQRQNSPSKEINNPFGQVPWNLKALLRFKVQEEKVILRSIRSRFSVVEKEATNLCFFQK